MFSVTEVVQQTTGINKTGKLCIIAKLYSCVSVYTSDVGAIVCYYWYRIVHMSGFPNVAFRRFGSLDTLTIV